MTPDITPRIPWQLRPTFAELIVPIDDAADARAWRELALAALDQLHGAHVEIGRLRRRVADLLDERRRAVA